MTDREALAYLIVAVLALALGIGHYLAVERDCDGTVFMDGSGIPRCLPTTPQTPTGGRDG